MTMPRCYTVEFENVSITTANGDHELFELDAAAEEPIELIGLEVYTLSELAEAQEEWLRLRIIRGHTTVGTGGATPTPQPVDDQQGAASFTAASCRTAIASAGTPINLASFGMNVRAGFERFWPEGCGFKTRGTSLLVVRLVAAVADDATMSGTAYVLEH